MPRIPRRRSNCVKFEVTDWTEAVMPHERTTTNK
jgi:hypothetical protein